MRNSKPQNRETFSNPGQKKKVIKINQIGQKSLICAHLVMSTSLSPHVNKQADNPGLWSVHSPYLQLDDLMKVVCTEPCVMQDPTGNQLFLSLLKWSIELQSSSFSLSSITSLGGGRWGGTMLQPNTSKSNREEDNGLVRLGITADCM